MTRNEFVANYKVKFLGLLLDAWRQNRSGNEMILWLRHAAETIESELRTIYDATHKQQTPRQVQE